MEWGRRAFASAFVITMVGAYAPLAYAQSDEARAGARAAATEGVKAIDEGRFSDAIDLFTRAESLVHAPPHLLYMARAYAKSGKLVRARETYLKVTRETWPPSAPRAFIQAHDTAESELAELEGRLATVKLDVQGAPEKMIVTMDDVPIPKALIGVAHPVDPGEHVFRARAKGLASDKVTRSIAEHATETVTLTLKFSSEPFADDSGESPPTPMASTSDEDAGQRATGAKSLRTLAFAGFGVGVAGAVVGTFFLVKNRSARDDADALCPNGRCPSSARPRVESLDSDADSAATVSWIGYGVGVAGLAAGSILMVMSTRDKKTSLARDHGVRVRPLLGLGSVGIAGSF